MKGGLRQKDYLEEASGCRFALDFITDTNQVLKMSWQTCSIHLEILSQGPAGVVTEVRDKIMAELLRASGGCLLLSAEKCFLFPARLTGGQSLICSVMIQARVINHEKQMGGPWTWI